MSIEEFEGALCSKLSGAFAKMSKETRCGQLQMNAEAADCFTSTIWTKADFNELEACMEKDTEWAGNWGVRSHGYRIVGDVNRLGRFLEDNSISFRLLESERCLLCILTDTP